MTDAQRKSRLERALLYGGPTHALADVAKMLESRTAQFWSNDEGLIVTEVQAFPLMKTVNYWLAAGDLRACLALQTEIDAWALRQGCEVATLTGRRGWCRALVSYGWRAHGYSLWKTLGGGTQFWSNLQ